MTRGLFLHFEGGGGSPHDRDAMLDLYVDGLLSAEDRAAFESQLRTDPALREQLELQKAVDSSLRTVFAVPETPAPDTADKQRTSAPRKSILARIGWMRIAALVAIVALGAALVAMRQWAKTAYPVESPITAYRSIVHGGFRPYEVCTDDAEFARYMQDHMGKAMVVKPFPGLALVGWDNRHNVMSIQTDALLATVDGAQVVVFMDRAENARSLPKRGEGLHVFKRTLAGVVLVEVTPLKEARLLPGFEEASVPCAGGR